MRATVFLFVLLSYLSFIFGNHKINRQSVTLGQPVKLTAVEKCPNPRWDHRLDDDRTRPVAAFDGGVFKPAADYENKVKQAADGSFSIVLNHATYNDQGYYEFSCGDLLVKTVQVKILVPIKLSVMEGQNATLSCYSVTTPETAKSVRWMRDGQLVFESDRSGNVSYGTGFEWRASVSSDGYREGDLSLTLKDVKQEDQGLYLCYHGEDRGKPDAVKLTVSPAAHKPTYPTPDKPSDQPATTERPMGPTLTQTSTPAAVRPTPDTTATPTENTKKAMGTLLAVLIAVFVTFVVTAPVSVALGWWLKSCWSNVSNSGTSSDVQQAVQMSDLNGSGETDPLKAPAVNNDLC